MTKAHGIALTLGLWLAWPSSIQAQTNPCDLTGDAVVDVADVQLAINMVIGQAVCTANIIGPGVCNIVVVQRVVNAAMGGTCVTGVVHSVSLNWTASTSSNVTGYHVYRGTVSNGPYTKLTTSPVSLTSYTDYSVQSGKTYYYVTTAVDSTANESIYSNEAPAVVPIP